MNRDQGGRRPVADRDGSGRRVGKRAAQSVAGFTILEVLLALVLVTIGALSLTQMQAVTISNNTLTVQRYEAIRLAETMAARLQTDTFTWVFAGMPPEDGLLEDMIGEGPLPTAEWSTHDGSSAPLNGRGVPIGQGDGLGGGTPYCLYWGLRAPEAGALDQNGLRMLWQADVRVYWARSRNAELLFADCAQNRAQIMAAAGLVPGSGNTVTNVTGGQDLGALEVLSVRTVTLLQRNTWWNGANRDDTLL